MWLLRQADSRLRLERSFLPGWPLSEGTRCHQIPPGQRGPFPCSPASVGCILQEAAGLFHPPSESRGPVPRASAGEGQCQPVSELLHVIPWEQPFFATDAALPPSRRIWKEENTFVALGTYWTPSLTQLGAPGQPLEPLPLGGSPPSKAAVRMASRCPGRPHLP